MTYPAIKLEAIFAIPFVILISIIAIPAYIKEKIQEYRENRQAKKEARKEANKQEK